MDNPLLSLLCFAVGGMLLIAAIWSIYYALPRFGLFVLGALGFPLWLFLLAILPGIGKLVLILLTLYWGYAAYATFHYRHVRRAEFLHLLATAAKSKLPIEEVISTSLREKPTHPFGRLTRTILHLMIPMFWLRSGRFEEQLRRLVYYLELGIQPSVAIAAVPGLASNETELALYVGESTGKLDVALESAQRTQRSLATAMIDNVPRTFYLGTVLAGWLAGWIFVVLFITPKFEKIFVDFKIRLPHSTELLIGLGRWVTRHGGLVTLAVFGFFLLMGSLFASSTVRWHTPIVRRIVRPWLQSRCLTMLGTLLEAGKPVPRALELLREIPFFAGTVSRRLMRVQYRVEQGRPLVEELRNEDLLPRSLMPLASVAVRSHSLPWAFQEMGEHLGRRTLQRVVRLGQVAFPMFIVLLGGLTLWYAYAMFSPMVSMIEGLL